jgi:hypothetical protein
MCLIPFDATAFSPETADLAEVRDVKAVARGAGAGKT